MCQIRFYGCGHILREFRETAGVGLRQLCEKLKWNSGTLSRFEHNEIGVEFDDVVKIADALGQPENELLARCFEKSLGPSRKQLAATICRLVRKAGKGA